MSGISITKATYGTGSKTVDVTSTVASRVKDGLLSFTVSTDALNVEDPAPGLGKNLDITYTINGGSPSTLYAKDGDPVIINAPPARQATGLEIIKAEYGAPGDEHIDVTDAVKSQVRNGSINMVVGFKEVGIPDPNPTRPKELVVSYKVNGAEATNTIRDGNRFRISAPPVDGSATVAETGDDLFGAFMNAAFTMFHTMVGTITVMTMYKIGETMKLGYIFGGFTAMFLLSPYTAFPKTFPNVSVTIMSLMIILGTASLAFILRLFRSTNWIEYPVISNATPLSNATNAISNAVSNAMPKTV